MYCSALKIKKIYTPIWRFLLNFAFKYQMNKNAHSNNGVIL